MIESLGLICVLVTLIKWEHRATQVGVAVVLATLAYKTVGPGFGKEHIVGIHGLLHFTHEEWVNIGGLYALLLVVTAIAADFKGSNAPAIMPRYLADNWRGGAQLQNIGGMMSFVVDNIASNKIMMATAVVIYAKVSVGFMTGITAAANAGGAGSPIGDTTTTMLWTMAQVAIVKLLPAAIGAIGLILFTAPLAAIAQQRKSPIRKDPPHPKGQEPAVDKTALYVMGGTLLAGVITNIVINARFPWLAPKAPWLPMALILARVIGSVWRKPHWGEVRKEAPEYLPLILLVIQVALVPLYDIPLPQTSDFWAVVLSALSVVFDNIPLMALAIRWGLTPGKGGPFDPALLALSEGTFGTVNYFASTAGYAIVTDLPEDEKKNIFWDWLREGWFNTPGIVIGLAMLFLWRHSGPLTVAALLAEYLLMYRLIPRWYRWDEVGMGAPDPEELPPAAHVED